VIRIAATADIHFNRNSLNRLRPYLHGLEERADVLLVAGDLTVAGLPEEAMVVARELSGARVPVVAVLGNHDYHQNKQREIETILRDSGVIVLEGNNVVLKVGKHSVGIAGMKGFGGGFFGACVTEFGEPELKAFARHSRIQASILRQSLLSLDTDFRFALTHYAPVEGTLLGELREIYPFLGSYLLAEAIDACGVQAGFHGHAHSGTEKGQTKGGVPIRNVAQMVIGHAYNVYSFELPVPHVTGSDFRPLESPTQNAASML